MDSSSESFGETESSPASAVCPTGEVGGTASLPLDEFSSRIPCGTSVEVAGFRLLVKACGRTLTERTNQLSKMMDDLEVKDHQLALKDRHWSCKIVELLT
jgi:hypothetical protein